MGPYPLGEWCCDPTSWRHWNDRCLQVSESLLYQNPVVQHTYGKATIFCSYIICKMAIFNYVLSKRCLFTGEYRWLFDFLQLPKGNSCNFWGLHFYSLVLELLGVVLGIFGLVGSKLDQWIQNSCRLRTSISHRLLCQRLRYPQVLRLLPVIHGFDKDGYPQITSVSVGGMRISWGCHQPYWGDHDATCFSRWLGHQNGDMMIIIDYPWWIKGIGFDDFTIFYLSILIYPWWRACSEHVRCWWDIAYQIRVFIYGKPVGEIRNFRIVALDHLTDPGGCVRLVLDYPAW